MARAEMGIPDWVGAVLPAYGGVYFKKGSFPQIPKPQILSTTLALYIVYYNLSKGSIIMANTQKMR
jgi:hypothetical protein